MTCPKLKVAIIIPSLCFGGAERQVIEISRGLKDRNVSVYILTFSDYVPLLNEFPDLESTHIIIKKRSRFDISVVWRLSMVLQELEISVAHAFLFDAEIATRLAGVLARQAAVIASERNANYCLPGWRRFLHKMTLPLVDLVVANSESGAKFHQELYGLDVGKYRVIRNGVDTNRFTRIQANKSRGELKIGEDSFVIGMFASFKRQKNHTMLIRSISSVKELMIGTRLLLVGDNLINNHANSDNYRDKIISELVKTGVSDFTTSLGNCDELADVYSACDVVVLPSYHEGFPNVVLEAMSCGVPCIVTDVSDNRSIVLDGRNGFVVDVDDHQALAARLLTLKSDGKLRRTFGIMARRSIEENFSIERLVDNYETTYRALHGE